MSDDDRGFRYLWDRFEGPTWLLAVAIYIAWGALVWFNNQVPWWLMVPLGAYVIAWQFSLQHETIHATRHVPKWLRYIIAFAPLGLWFPYPLYVKSHTRHHRNTWLTVPGEDPESYYHRAADWKAFGPAVRAVYISNQTLLGRLTIGPLIRLWKLFTKEIGRIRQRDLSHVRSWLVHALSLAILFGFISGICGMPWWQYILLIAYPGMSLGLLRAFIEHRAGDRPGERTASVESNWVFGLLFLFNNLHIAHHLQPELPWYRIPGFYKQNRQKLLDHNGHFVFPGYGQIAARYLLKPVFLPVHPSARR